MSQTMLTASLPGGLRLAMLGKDRLTMSNRHVRRAIGASVLTAAIFCMAGAAVSGAETDPLQIDAVYKVSLNDFEIGDFSFKSEVGEKTYLLESSVKISVAGLIGWKGETRTQGAIASKAPNPTGYNFSYESPAKSGSVTMNFNKGGVTGLTIQPSEDPLPGHAADHGRAHQGRDRPADGGAQHRARSRARTPAIAKSRSSTASSDSTSCCPTAKRCGLPRRSRPGSRRQASSARSSMCRSPATGPPRKFSRWRGTTASPSRSVPFPVPD